MTNRIRANVVPPDAAEAPFTEAVTGSGYRLVLASHDAGSAAAGPMDTVLAALAGCTAADVAGILHKKRQRPTSYQLAVSGERAQEHPRVFTRITVEHIVAGEVTPEALRRSVELSATRYCSVSGTLSRGVEVEHRYRLMRDGEPELTATVMTTGPALR